MNTKPRPCALCDHNSPELLVDLPGLPLTDSFCREAPDEPPATYDQSLVQCPECGHVQLAKFLDPALLYSADYNFRTGASPTGRHGTAAFLRALEKLAGGRTFRLAVDIGCNDLFCLKQLEGRAQRRVGVDPIWTGDQPPDSEIEVIGSIIENADLIGTLGDEPDLLVCRHTLEHLWDPRAVVRSMLDMLTPDGILMLEVPGLEAMVEKSRFDHVFHQHLHYFSQPVLHRLIADCGGAVVHDTVNWHDWGARLIAVRKNGPSETTDDLAQRISSDSIRQRYAAFRRRMDSVIESLEFLREGVQIVGYGAAQMLPVLAWHLRTDFSYLHHVVDDDPTKNGMWYSNLPVEIQSVTADQDFTKSAVLITAPDHARAIIAKLQAIPPRHIVHPLGLL